MSSLKGSSSTVGASTATLLRGAKLLDGVASFGVVKQEPDEEEEQILQEIQAPTNMVQLFYSLYRNSRNAPTCTQALRERLLVKLASKAGESSGDFWGITSGFIG